MLLRLESVASKKLGNLFIFLIQREREREREQKIKEKMREDKRNSIIINEAQDIPKISLVPPQHL